MSRNTAAAMSRDPDATTSGTDPHRWPGAAWTVGLVDRLRAATRKARYRPERHYMRGRRAAAAAAG